ncbi:ABC transporter substrate-binding protein [Paenibacillus baekrokdamisoli]|uniref:ABC transporter substrate-binding protein n=1 Tax=Paenibacillus baekrokdamisoli TaxID=1712516 RepID=A0A3G9JC24_9BACL|nr:basic amino acid ABC transporter substrate-binding protein [Paenibacillus baekrokdamisoli]MBB3068638.1 polar amino acid transport system substrate-binding protein [Paenibacillus baekrokdamisoli]BBH23471.1 ABC transporter substrate-binding protein [Paenibacillus baekrokdamisoli]
MKKSQGIQLITILLIGLLTLAGCGSGKSASNSNANPAASSSGDKKVLILGTSPDYPPYENVDAKNNGDIIGFDIDIARAIATKLGYELKIQSMDFNGLIAALQSKRVDFVMSGMSITPARQKNVDFSDVYFVAKNTIASKVDAPYATLEELKNKRIGVQLGSTQEQVVADLKDAAIKKLNRIPDLFQELKSNRIDAAIIEDAVAKGYVKDNPDLKFTVIPAEKEEGYAIALPKGSPLVGDINKALKELSDNGVKDQLIKKWFE